MSAVTHPPPPPPVEGPGKTRLVTWAVAAALVVVAILAIISVVQRQRRTVPLRIATGLKGGTFLPLGEELAATLNHDRDRFRARAVESPGSLISVDMLERGEVELALVSNNTQRGDHVRLVAVLYPETLQVVVRSETGIAAPHDLAGKRVAVGPSGSGTETIAWQVLEHFGLPKDRLQAESLPTMDAASKLESGAIDAAFFVAGLRAPVVDRLLARKDMTLLSLGTPGESGNELEGLHIDAPYLHPSVIPRRTYGDKPTVAVGTIGVKALLVARADLDETVVAEVTETLFAAKLRLAKKEKLLAHLTEKFDPADSPWPLHPGADRYLRRNEPSLIQKNTHLIRLVLALGGLSWSAITALRAWRKRSRKGRIELYFANLAELTKQVRAARTEAEIDELMMAVNETEARALGELASERLEANDAFRVLQEGLRTLEDDLIRVRARVEARA